MPRFLLPQYPVIRNAHLREVQPDMDLDIMERALPLPDELILQILSYLPLPLLPTISEVSRHLRTLTQDPTLYTALYPYISTCAPYPNYTTLLARFGQYTHLLGTLLFSDTPHTGGLAILRYTRGRLELLNLLLTTRGKRCTFKVFHERAICVYPAPLEDDDINDDGEWHRRPYRPRSWQIWTRGERGWPPEVLAAPAERDVLRVRMGLGEGMGERIVQFAVLAEELWTRGVWVARYGGHGGEVVTLVPAGRGVKAAKVTGDVNVPRGEVTWEIPQWGERGGKGRGLVASAGFKDREFWTGQKGIEAGWLTLGTAASVPVKVERKSADRIVTRWDIHDMEMFDIVIPYLKCDLGPLVRGECEELVVDFEKSALDNPDDMMDMN